MIYILTELNAVIHCLLQKELLRLIGESAVLRLQPGAATFTAESWQERPLHSPGITLRLVEICRSAGDMAKAFTSACCSVK